MQPLPPSPPLSERSDGPSDGAAAEGASPRKVRRSSSFGRAVAATARGTAHAANTTARLASGALQPTGFSFLLPLGF